MGFVTNFVEPHLKKLLRLLDYIFRLSGMIRMTNQTTTDWGILEKSTKQTTRYLIYLANLFLNQNMQRLFRWKRISPPLKLETLVATFWVPETTKRP